MSNPSFDLQQVVFNLLFNAAIDRPNVMISVSELVDDVDAKAHQRVTDEDVRGAIEGTRFRQHQQANGALPYDIHVTDGVLSAARMTEHAMTNQEQYYP